MTADSSLRKKSQCHAAEVRKRAKGEPPIDRLVTSGVSRAALIRERSGSVHIGCVVNAA